MLLERMEDFFEQRLDGYEEHQLNNISYARMFYPFTASCLPREEGCSVLDLGCGTGLELDDYFCMNETAKVTGIDLAGGMLEELRSKFPKKDLTLVKGSYFEVPFGEEVYDAAVSVESLHHFTMEEKSALYQKLHKALKENGYFILTDYMVETAEEEELHFSELARIKKEQSIADGCYHYDTPLTVEHEKQALLNGGFSKVERLNVWKDTVTLKAYK